MTQLSELDVATRLARWLGLESTDPGVIYSGMNVLVHLRPSPVVARVTRLAHLVRPISDLAGGIALARREEVRGRVIQPTTLIDPGPHLAEKRYVTFWAYLGDPNAVGHATPAEAGSSLRDLHQRASLCELTLRSFDPRPEALRIADLVAPEIASVLRAAASSIRIPDLPHQPIHGDAHEENALPGGIWQDLDEVCSGPPEWDLACLQHRRYLFGEREVEIGSALQAYGTYEEEAVDLLGPAVVLAIAAWGSLAPHIGESVGPRTWKRLHWLRATYS